MVDDQECYGRPYLPTILHEIPGLNFVILPLIPLKDPATGEDKVVQNLKQVSEEITQAFRNLEDQV